MEKLSEYPSLRPRGLMTLAMLNSDPSRVRSCFTLLAYLRDQAAMYDQRIVDPSMGMSSDFEAAIEEGSTVVRIGQAMFGRRPGGSYWPDTEK